MSNPTNASEAMLPSTARRDERPRALGLSVLLGTLVLAGAASPALADSRGDRATPALEWGRMGTVLRRVQRIAATDYWKTPGWRDEVIERWLAEVVEEVERATGKELKDLPRSFREISARGDFRKRGGLLVGHDLALVSVKKSIFLADGDFEAARVDDSIVIARGSVKITHGNRNLIVAGHHLTMTFDGSDALKQGLIRINTPKPGPPVPHGSVLVSGSYLYVANLRGSVCSAADYLHVSHAFQGKFLNSPRRYINNGHHCRQVADAKLKTLFAKRREPLPVPLEVVRVVNERRRHVIASCEGEEFRVPLGAPVAEEAKRPLPLLHGWKLETIDDGFALFSDGTRYVSFCLK